MKKLFVRTFDPAKLLMEQGADAWGKLPKGGSDLSNRRCQHTYPKKIDSQMSVDMGCIGVADTVIAYRYDGDSLSWAFIAYCDGHGGLAHSELVLAKLAEECTLEYVDDQDHQ